MAGKADGRIDAKTGTETRELVHVDDVTTAEVLALGRDDATDEPVKLATGVETSIPAIAEGVCWARGELT